MAEQKVHPDYMYLSQDPNRPDNTVYFTDADETRKRQLIRKRRASNCAILTVFFLVSGLALITFFYIAPIMRLTRGSYYDNRQGAHHSDCIKLPENQHGMSGRREPSYFEHMRGISYHGRMCLRRCFRARSFAPITDVTTTTTMPTTTTTAMPTTTTTWSPFPQDDVAAAGRDERLDIRYSKIIEEVDGHRDDDGGKPAAAPDSEDSAGEVEAEERPNTSHEGSREVETWNLLIRHTEHKLFCLRKCKTWSPLP